MKLLKFYTQTCGQCKALNELLKDFTLVPIENIDCEEDKDNLVEKYQIRGIPSLVLINDNGEFLRKFTGVIQKDSLENLIKTELTAI
jgi:thioredoxin-like negative regulator of GroEL